MTSRGPERSPRTSEGERALGASPPFHPVDHPEPVFSLVARRLIAAIESGRLPSGSCLPTEYSLAKQFGVSRSSIREALCCLRFNGYTSGSRGSGTVVLGSGLSPLSTRGNTLPRAAGGPERVDRDQDSRQHRSPEPGAPQRPAEVIDLLEARLLLEPAAVALAADACGEEGTAGQLESVKKISLGAHHEHLAGGTDLELHRALLLICPNSSLADAAVHLLERSDGPLWRSVRDRAWDDGRLPGRWLDDHRRIAISVLKGDGAAAADRMRVHLVSVLKNVASTTALGARERARVARLSTLWGSGHDTEASRRSSGSAL